MIIAGIFVVSFVIFVLPQSLLFAVTTFIYCYQTVTGDFDISLEIVLIPVMGKETPLNAKAHHLMIYLFACRHFGKQH